MRPDKITWGVSYKRWVTLYFGAFTFLLCLCFMEVFSFRFVNGISYVLGTADVLPIRLRISSLLLTRIFLRFVLFVAKCEADGYPFIVPTHVKSLRDEFCFCGENGDNTAQGWAELSGLAGEHIVTHWYELGAQILQLDGSSRFRMADLESLSLLYWQRGTGPTSNFLNLVLSVLLASFLKRQVLR